MTSHSSRIPRCRKSSTNRALYTPSKTCESHDGESKSRADAIQHGGMRYPAWKGDLVWSSLQVPLDVSVVRRSKIAEGSHEELEGLGF